MKYTIRNKETLVALALCAIFAMYFTSCSKDDDEPEKPKVEKRMKSLDKTFFVYTDGKITQTLWNGSVDDNIIYTETSIKIDDETYYLNDGLVTKYVESDGWYQEFTYEDRRIKTWKKYNAIGTLREDISFEWKDGVIVRQTDIGHEDNEIVLYCDYQYSYTTSPDYGGAVAAFQYDFILYDDLPEVLIIQGYFGKWPKYLVSEIVDVYDHSGKAYSYTYIFDSDGYPKIMSGINSVSFTWENVNN